MYVRVSTSGAAMWNPYAVVGAVVPGASAVGKRRGLGSVVAAGAAAGPWGAAIAGAIQLGIIIFFEARKRGAQKVAATQVANEAEVELKANVDRYLALEHPTADQQRDALMVFDFYWGELVQLCSNPELGSAGQRCISERQPGGQWDWFAYYRAPIEERAPEPMRLSAFDQPGASLPGLEIFAGGSMLLLVAIALLVFGVAG
jgi:hypothetical protein